MNFLNLDGLIEFNGSFTVQNEKPGGQSFSLLRELVLKPHPARRV